jgi:hypothetical protein
VTHYHAVTNARYAVDPVLNAKVTLTREFWLSLPVDAVTVRCVCVPHCVLPQLIGCGCARCAVSGEAVSCCLIHPAALTKPYRVVGAKIACCMPWRDQVFGCVGARLLTRCVVLLAVTLEPNNVSIPTTGTCPLPLHQAETATFPDTGRGFGDFKERCPTGDAVISHGHNLRQVWWLTQAGEAACG